MLPLDEPPLDINANTRAISIPANFKTHGLSVEGDELAETLFFRIDRYFDAMDLSTCEIFVQWLLPDKKTTYATVIYMIDVESEPGKLIFACPLTSEITQAAGAIELSVRFIKRGVGNDIVYSFNTLPARASINATMKFDATTIQQVSAEEIKSLFTAAIENSDKATGEPAPAPVFTILLGGENATLNSVTRVYLNDGTATLRVQADANPAGEISYEWFRLSGIDGWPEKIDNSGAEYEIHADDELVDIEAGDYMERTVTGVYQVRAINRISDKSAKAWSDKVIIDAPVKVELKDLAPAVFEKDAVLTVEIAKDENPYDKSTLHYLWTRTSPEGVESATGNNSAILALEAPGYYKVKVGAELNGDIAYRDSNSVRVTPVPDAVEFAEPDTAALIHWNIYSDVYGDKINPEVTAPEIGDFTADEVTYQWFHDALADGNLETEITEAKATPELNVQGLVGTIVRCVATVKLNNRQVTSKSAAYQIEEIAVS